MIDEYYKYIQPRMLKNNVVDKKNINVVCECGSRCKLISYFNHCNSNKHTLYLIRNNKNYIYCIIDISI